MPAATFQLGQLVEVQGLSAPVEVPDGMDERPRQMNGERGQCIEWEESTGHWIVHTFSGSLVAVKENFLKGLTSSDVDDFDIALGPKSDPAIMGSEMVDKLQSKGFVLTKLFLATDDLKACVEAAEQGVQEDLFARLPTELEEGYMGKDSFGKTMYVNMSSDSTPDFIKQSPIGMLDGAMSTIGSILQPFVEQEFDFSIHSRSDTLVVLPFDGDEDQFIAPDLDNEDAANFLAMMWRSGVMMCMNAGPGTGTLKLIPKRNGDMETALTLKPGMVAVWMPTRWKFAWSAEDKCMRLVNWLLEAPRNYVVDKITGSLESMGLLSKGPVCPKGEDGIAVTAMGSRYAFGVDQPWKLWIADRHAGWDTFIEFPIMRWDVNLYYQEDADQTSGLSYTRHGGFSDDIEMFDCKFFDISPAEARGMDPTQRNVLEVSYISLQGGGWTKKFLQKEPAQIAVFVGLDKNEWITMPKDSSAGFGASSSANAITSNRFSYCMNLKGASMTIDTACSASLVCTHTAKLYLLFKHFDPCSAAVTCGVNLLLSPGSFMGCCGAGMLSHIGRCFTFNFSADGYARGESTGSHCMKRHAHDIEQDLGMIAGSQVNQDGRSASMTAPNGPSQERCMQACLKEAKITPPEVDTAECHGTGTSLGDPIEVGAFRKVQAAWGRHEPILTTSRKSNIGHCEGSAGISGFLSCIKMCMHAEVCPNAHLNCYNPHLDLDGFPCIFLTEGATMRADKCICGVLSFGFGGTNAIAQCWGQNIASSRAAGKQDFQKLFIERIRNAPAQDVTIVGDDWEDWEMGGPERDSKEGDSWTIELDQEGNVSYDKHEEEEKDMGSSFYLAGTFNEWSYEAMEQDTVLSGLYSSTVTIGPTGEECFQVVADEDPAMTFSAVSPGCTMKSFPALGPAPASREMSWCIRGQPGDSYKVEWYRSEGNKVSLNWIKTSRALEA